MPSPRRFRYSKYRWNPSLGTTGRYIDEQGRMVPAETMRAEMERVISGTREEILDLSKRLHAHEISGQEWYDGMKKSIKTIHSCNAAISRGGWAQMTQGDWGAVGAITKDQYKYLNNFAAEIESSEQPLNGNFLRRAGMYGDASRGTGEQMARRDALANGNDEERRVLGVADHCHTAGGLLGCVELAAKGWQPIGTLPRIGGAPCRTNCKCHFEFRKSDLSSEIDSEDSESQEELMLVDHQEAQDWLNSNPSLNPDLTEEESDAMAYYKGDGFYDINSDLREAGYSEDDRADIIERVIDRASVDRPVVTFRGADREVFDESDLTDAIIIDDAFVSTSLVENIAELHADGVILEIHVPAGAKAISAERWSSEGWTKGEAELILQRNAKFRVISDNIDDDPDVRRLVVELII